MLEYAKENPAMVNSLSLVHGYVTGQASYVKDQRYGHGWLEIGDVVQDCTNNAVMRKEQYYKLGNINPDELKKYSYKDVLQKISTTKHYGPWDLEKTEFEKGIEEDVVGMNPSAKKPYFSPQEADRANNEWVNQAQVDQGDGVIIKATDGKQYRIMTSYGNQHFEDGEVYLDGITDAGFIDPEGYPDAAELLYYHSATGHYPDDEEYEVQENFKDGKKKGKSRPGRVKKAGASCNGSVTSLRKKAKNSSGEKSKMYHWCANMKAGRKKK
jgi:hypothetical protein